MNNISFLSFLIIVLLFFTTTLVGQSNSVYNSFESIEDYQEHKKLYTDYVRVVLGIDNPNKVHRLYTRKVNVTSNSKFETNFKKGVSSLFFKNQEGFTHLRDALQAPLVVTGTILGRVYNTGKDERYHTTYSIRIDDVVYTKGVVLKKKTVIQIKLMDGPVGDRFVRTVNSDKYFVGEKILLFAHPITDLIEKRIQYLVTDKEKMEVSRRILSKKIGVNMTDGLVFLPRSKFAIKDGNVIFGRNTIIPLKKVIADIKTVEEINDFSQFLDKKLYVIKK